MGGITLRKIAPIIHTRTFSCDFNPEFLVRPDSFIDSDIKWARNYVLGATKEIDSLKGFRWLIVDNENYRMAGAVGFLKDIYSECKLSKEDKVKSEELFCDNKGRLVYAFIGIVIDKHQSNNYGELTLDYLWRIYLDKIYPIWKRQCQEVILESFKNDEYINTIDMNNTKFGDKDGVKVNSKLFIEANAIRDYQLFLEFLCNKNKNKFSFCSNIIDFNIVKQSEFSIITTSPNNITRINRENKGGQSNEQEAEKFPDLEKSGSKSSADKKKIGIKAIISVVIVLMMLLIMINLHY